MSQTSQFGPRPRIATTRPRIFGDVRDELGKVEGCTCEPAEHGHYSGTMMPDCRIHRRGLVRSRRDHWVYQGAGVARGYGESVEGKRCYWFRLENIGQGGTTLVIPIDEYWSRGIRT